MVRGKIQLIPIKTAEVTFGFSRWLGITALVLLPAFSYPGSSVFIPGPVFPVAASPVQKPIRGFTRLKTYKKNTAPLQRTSHLLRVSDRQRLQTWRREGSRVEASVNATDTPMAVGSLQKPFVVRAWATAEA